MIGMLKSDARLYMCKRKLYLCNEIMPENDNLKWWSLPYLQHFFIYLQTKCGCTIPQTVLP